jgi:D-alanyl-D-alanine carboxypeptidase (penicillin-binding protein 5/6)
MKLSRQIIATVLMFACAWQVFAAVDVVPAPPQIDATSYILLDANSGQILTTKDADKRIEPASLTKIMTAYVVEHEIARGTISMDDEVPISVKAWKMHGSRMFVREGTKVPLRKLMLGMIVQSGNDASVALAEYTAGSEDSFVTLMNQYAKRLGMKNTHFANCTGWPHKNHYSTAHDLAILTRALIHEFPKQYAMYKIKDFTYNNIHQSNRNRLLWVDDRVDGVKTGHTESAGYCLIASAKDKDMRLISVVTGTDSERARESSSRKLLGYGFRFYESHKLYDAHQALTQWDVWKGAKDQVPLGLDRSLYVTIPRGRRGDINAQMNVNARITAPVTKGADYGTVKIRLGDDTLVERPLVALEEVPVGGLWTRMIDSIVLLFK